MKKNNIYLVGVCLIVFFAGYFVRGIGQKSGEGEPAPVDVEESVKTEVWTCAMHPQIRQPGPGKCPICGMDLIPVKDRANGGNLNPRQIKLSPQAQKLAEIQTAPVERKFVAVEVRMVGKVNYDETKLAYITAWVPGRLDRLYVDYTGVSVAKGDHMVSLYSPELLAAQEEMIQAIKVLNDLEKSENTLIHGRAESTVRASREKLRLWGLTEEQIRTIETNENPSDHLTIYSPVSGIVIHKNAVEGLYVQTGSQIYTIADLSKVWVKLDAYESDLAWIHYGQEVTFSAEAYPGETFNGRIAFIAPVLDPKTRTVKIRVNVSNPEGRLKPEMFVRAIVRSEVATEGKVIDPALAGKWMCPMHPEVVKDEIGECDICGMPLVSSESLGYVSTENIQLTPPLVIPATAPLITGTRAVVYIAVANQKGIYEGREIVLGQRAGDYYLVHKGLKEGEQVVVNGAFKIDSAVQILAKPSMMSPSGGRTLPGHHHEQTEYSPKLDNATASNEQMQGSVASTEQLQHVLSIYLKIQTALANDDFETALIAGNHLDMTVYEGGVSSLEHPLHQFIATKNIEKARSAFALLSSALRDVFTSSGIRPDQPVYVLHCPMALDGQGAIWLQETQEILNPYLGNAMLKCGSVKQTIQ